MAEASLTGARVTPPCCLAPPPPNRGVDVTTPLRCCCPHDGHVCTVPRRRLIRPRTSSSASLPPSPHLPPRSPLYADVCRGCRELLAAASRRAVDRDEERDDEAAAAVVTAAQQWRSRVLCRTFKSMLLLAGSPPGSASLQSGSLQPESKGALRPYPPGSSRVLSPMSMLGESTPGFNSRRGATIRSERSRAVCLG